MFIVEDIMTPIVCEIPANKLVCEVEGILVSENISGAPLVNGKGIVVGLITKSDIVHFDFIGGDTYTTPASEISTMNIVTVKPTDSVKWAAQKMIQNDVHRLLVVDNDRMVGMVSVVDVVKLVANSGVTELPA